MGNDGAISIGEMLKHNYTITNINLQSNQIQNNGIIGLCKSLEKITREMPGCSVSVQAPPSSFNSLEESGFILDPNGIRVMGYKLWFVPKQV